MIFINWLNTVVTAARTAVNAAAGGEGGDFTDQMRIFYFSRIGNYHLT